MHRLSCGRAVHRWGKNGMLSALTSQGTWNVADPGGSAAERSSPLLSPPARIIGSLRSAAGIWTLAFSNKPSGLFGLFTPTMKTHRVDVHSNVLQPGAAVWWALDVPAQISLSTFTFTFSHLADAFVQSDVQGREYSSYEQ